jgi:hypothetical protein
MSAMTLFAGLLLGIPLVAAAAAAPASLEFGASAWVDVDTSGNAHVTEMGKVTDLGDVPKLAPIVDKIKSRLRARIESWQFIPATRNGVVVASKTHVRASLEGFDDGSGGLGIRILSANTGSELKDNNYSGIQAAGQKAGEEGLVTLDITYGEDGKVRTVLVHDSKTFNQGQFGGHASRDLRRGLMEAARAWLLVPEQVAGQPVSGEGRTTIIFCFSTACTSAARSSSDRKIEPLFTSVDPAVKLRSAVVDTAL